MVAPVQLLTGTVARTINEFVDSLQTAAPRLLSGLVLLTIAHAAIRLLTAALRRTLDSVYPADQRPVADLGVTVASIFLWFGVALTLLKIFGMSEIAASLGTAAGFVALGVSYALSNMLGDTVAGVYLLRDPDFNPGDEINADPVTGTVTAIELRKTRFRNEAGRDSRRREPRR